MALGEKLLVVGNLWDPELDYFWNIIPSSPPPPLCGIDIVAYALHPDGRTIFMSTASATHSVDTSNGSWKELGDWVLPFKGQAYFDDNLDAWVGIHGKEDGYICCCPVASRSRTTRRPPDCRMLNEKLFLRNSEKTWRKKGRHMKATLTYMGYSRFCLVENILRRADGLDSVLHVTLFTLKYDGMGELRNKVHPCTRSYAVSKNTRLFSHAAFWM
ncbi:uncharacterized protein LOC123408608 [Hordeum vulgare subsp. vulgare]|uniref:uncharacterized protein LOC123408608 n=1 Tax=Hordeum vulgare subsp. vulgare TaxID=112509 RepID=UPI001D1A38D3|nr:uncharacterized protein LOC123408608 [Hordeum vulgare subsp. vulgare]